MVNANSILILIALASLGTATPTPEAEIVHSDFSFAKWVDTLISDPEHALTPEQALATAKATLHTRSAVDKRDSHIDCIQRSSFPAGEADAVTCINFLAAAGRAGVTCPVHCSPNQVAFAGTARILTQSARCEDRRVNCDQVARAAGLIMDNCWRADHTVAGNALAPEPDDWVFVHLIGPD